jgi:hypothetical protein
MERSIMTKPTTLREDTIDRIDDSAWLDGFQNVLWRGETSSRNDNPYLTNEEPEFSRYKAGARAAEIFIKHYEI